MKVFLFPENPLYNQPYSEFEISDAVSGLPVKELTYAIFGMLANESSMSATTRIRCPFLLNQPNEPTKGGFFWHTLDEHQGAHEFFPILFGDWNKKELKAIADENDPIWHSTCSEYLEEMFPDLDFGSVEMHVLSANGLLEHFGVNPATKEDFGD